MKNRRILTVVLAVIMAFGLVACGGGNKPAETDATEPETKETTEEETKVNEPKEEEAEEAEPEEPQSRIPENATEFLLTNPKIQAQAKFYLPNEAKEWEIQCLNKKDPVNVPQRYVYKSENTDGDVLMMDIRLTATGTENLAEMLADEDTEKIQVQNYPASLETTDTSWNYTIDLGSFTEGLNLYVSVYFETGDEEYASIKELADTRDMFLETLTVTTDYEGKEDRSGRKYQGVGMCSLPDTIEYHGETVEIIQVPQDFQVYSLKAEVYDSDPIPTRVVATINNTISNAYLEAEGYEECTIAGYSGIMKQTLFYGYVSSYLRLKITESTNYDVYATTYVDDSVLTDPGELAAAANTMKNDPDTYYQKSLELLEAMLTAAEFREPVDSWFE